MLYSADRGSKPDRGKTIAGEGLMLVLTRKAGEEIIINGEIRVSVVLVRGNRVRLGIEAPANVRIQRRELAPSCSERRQIPAGAACLR
jgi:carbon storage regulator